MWLSVEDYLCPTRGVFNSLGESQRHGGARHHRARASAKRLATMLGAALIVWLALCGLGRAVEPEPPLAVATISILADLTRAVAGDLLAVESIVHVGGDPHVYQPVPSDARKLARAAIVIRNGLGLERGLDKLIGASSSGRAVVTVTDGIAPLIQTNGTYAGKPDPHMWMDPSLTMHYVAQIRDGLAARFPEHADRFAENAEGLLVEIAGLDDWIGSVLASIPSGNRKLVTTHDAFRYFGQRYGLDVVATIWGISTEREPSAYEVGNIVRAIRTNKVPVVFIETTINPKLMTRIALEAGIKVGAPLYGDSVGVRGSGAETYLGMMRANAHAIAAALTPIQQTAQNDE